MDSHEYDKVLDEVKKIGRRVQHLIQGVCSELISGKATLKQAQVAHRKLKKLASMTWQTTYHDLWQLQRTVVREKKESDKQIAGRALLMPAPPCPYCKAQPATMGLFIAHLNDKHGWDGLSIRWKDKGKCACGVGASWPKHMRAACLAHHLLSVGDLEVHLVKATIKQQHVKEES